MAIPVRERSRKCENRISGAGGRQKLKGTKDGDRIVAKGGNDSAGAKAGKDCVSGGGGRDKLRGGKGADKVSGGAGRDLIVGGKGHDKLRGGAGARDLIKARDRTRDVVNCGGGRRDRAVVDRKDRVRGCELVSTKRR
jgi:Ca2+-binding RTX toxin-like protein